MEKLAGKVAVITGGSSGIGLAAAKLMAEEGATVIIVARNEKKLNLALQELGKNAVAVSADTSSVSGITKLILEIKLRFGQIDILFANAGMSDCPPVLDTDEQFFNQLFDTNVKSVFFLFSQAFALLKNGSSVIFTSSVSHKMGRPGDPLYAASKAAVRSLGRTLAMQQEVLDRKIRVNVVSPGAVATPLTRQDNPEMQTAIDGFIAGAVPMGRWGGPDEIARGVLYLASEDSSYVTGFDLVIDGGWSA